MQVIFKDACYDYDLAAGLKAELSSEMNLSDFTFSLSLSLRPNTVTEVQFERPSSILVQTWVTWKTNVSAQRNLTDVVHVQLTADFIN